MSPSFTCLMYRIKIHLYYVYSQLMPTFLLVLPWRRPGVWTPFPRWPGPVSSGAGWAGATGVPRLVWRPGALCGPSLLRGRAAAAMSVVPSLTSFLPLNLSHHFVSVMCHLTMDGIARLEGAQTLLQLILVLQHPDLHLPQTCPSFLTHVALESIEPPRVLRILRPIVLGLRVFLRGVSLLAFVVIIY